MSNSQEYLFHHLVYHLKLPKKSKRGTKPTASNTTRSGDCLLLSTKIQNQDSHTSPPSIALVPSNRRPNSLQITSPKSLLPVLKSFASNPAKAVAVIVSVPTQLLSLMPRFHHLSPEDRTFTLRRTPQTVRVQRFHSERRMTSLTKYIISYHNYH
jgi:hypothetical protein